MAAISKLLFSSTVAVAVASSPSSFAFFLCSAPFKILVLICFIAYYLFLSVSMRRNACVVGECLLLLLFCCCCCCCLGLSLCRGGGLPQEELCLLTAHTHCHCLSYPAPMVLLLSSSSSEDDVVAQ